MDPADPVDPVIFTQPIVSLFPALITVFLPLAVIAPGTQPHKIISYNLYSEQKPSQKRRLRKSAFFAILGLF